MKQQTLIIPGWHGSGEQHWQTWLEQHIPDARRVSEIDWEEPVLANWAQAVRQAIDAAACPVWLVAHSFGCLASVVAAVDRRYKVAGVMLVAPADPQRFCALGPLQQNTSQVQESLLQCLPQTPLGMPCLMVASSNDPWMKLTTAAWWAKLWGARFHNLGQAGHINTESGFGPWPQGLHFLQHMQTGEEALLLGSLDAGSTLGAPPRRTRRDSALAKVRHLTRRNAIG